MSPSARVPDEYLTPNPFVDSDHPRVVEYARRHQSTGGEVATAVALYYAIRDGFRYNPFEVSLEPEGYRASGTAEFLRPGRKISLQIEPFRRV